MDTDQLIRSLAADNAHRPPRVGAVLTMALLVAAPLSILIFATFLGVRHDVMSAMHNPFFDMKFAVTLSLAFGFGAREIARSLTSSRYARTDFAVGQTIRVGDVRGEIVRLDAAAVTLKAGDETIRVPNSVVVERIVVIEGPPPPIV